MKSLFLEVRPEPINVGNVEDQPPPLGRGVAVFQIQDRVLSVFRAERGKIASTPKGRGGSSGGIASGVRSGFAGRGDFSARDLPWGTGTR